ncbi:MAG: TlpA family protein disulfide reductase, partial [Acidimicrobiia bacterium]|nr:TlpA family protein disulfide reductase [Acidimicrobiia bacterium]
VVIDGAGQPTAVVFLAHWCPHCQAEVVEVQEWIDQGGGVDGVAIVSVATATEPVRDNYPPSEWLSDWTPPVLLDDADGSVMAAFGGNAFPFWAFVDADGRVVSRQAGSLDIPVLVELMTATK